MPGDTTIRNPEIDVTQAAWLSGFLSFTEDAGPTAVRERFTMLVAERFGARIARIAGSNERGGANLSRRLEELPNDRFLRILLAPESVHRLLWPEMHQAADIALFFERAVEAERGLCGLDACLDSPSWTAVGDEWCGENSRVTVLKMKDYPPFVLADPRARHPLADSGDAMDEEHQLSKTSLALVKKRLREVRERLKATDNFFWAFARDFNITLVLRRTGGEPRGFRSSSP